MNESIEKNQKPLETTSELTEKFDKLDESGIANSTVTSELFKSGKEGEEKVIKKIGEIKETVFKDTALFRIAKLYYEQKKDIQTALQKANEIQNQNEKVRCLVHLANAVIASEGNFELADKIIGQITEDKEEYTKYYEKVKSEYIENHEKVKE
jgi:predicted S18 family serine protease